MVLFVTAVVIVCTVCIFFCCTVPTQAVTVSDIHSTVSRPFFFAPLHGLFAFVEFPYSLPLFLCLLHSSLCYSALSIFSVQRPKNVFKLRKQLRVLKLSNASNAQILILHKSISSAWLPFSVILALSLFPFLFFSSLFAFNSLRWRISKLGAVFSCLPKRFKLERWKVWNSASTTPLFPIPAKQTLDPGDFSLWFIV